MSSLHKILLLIIACWSSSCTSISSIRSLEKACVGELFTYKIEPVHFNWTHQVLSTQFRYRPSLRGYPDLPSWLRFMYSHEYHAGYLYGTPPEHLAEKTVELDIVALNKQNYETRQLVLPIYIAPKYRLPHTVHMKIENLNWVHLMDPGRVENLLNIFRKELWPGSVVDLSVIFMESSVNMGGRLPLQPQQREGVIVHLGSSAAFSERLLELQEEVRPLYKLPSCTYKRTSVQKLFENVGFKLDWCAFRLVGLDFNSDAPELHYHNKLLLDKADIGNLKRTDLSLPHDQLMTKEEAPTRNYIDEFAFAVGIPAIIFAILLGILSAVLCFQHEKLLDPQSEYFFDNIFHICEESCAAEHHDSSGDEESIHAYTPNITSTVQMVQCSDTTSNQPVTTLKSLKDPNSLLDNASMRSMSPSGNFYQLDSPSNTYLRPKPPPYKGGTLGRSSGGTGAGGSIGAGVDI